MVEMILKNRLNHNHIRFANLLSFIDLLFNLMLGFAAMFILAALMISPITEINPKELPRPNEYLIRIEWQGNLDSDMDLWVKAPNNEICGYQNRQTPTMYLERDNLGNDSDVLTNPNHVNEEIVNLMTLQEGTYIVNVNWFSRRTVKTLPIIKWYIIKMKPSMQTLATGEVTFTEPYQEKTVISFSLNKEGDLVDKDTVTQTQFAISHAINSGALVH